MRTRLHYTIDTTENAIVIDGMLLSVEDIRLIVNESQSKVLCSSMKKNLIAITQTDNSTHIAVSTSVCTFALTDDITIEVDTCVPLATEQAATDNKNAILAAIGGSSGEIGLKPMMEIIMQGFNFSEELADMQALTDTEIQDTCDEIWEQVVPNEE